MGKSGMNFKNEAAYKRYLAYGHSTGVFERTPGNTPVSIQGKPKAVNHAKSKPKKSKPKKKPMSAGAQTFASKAVRDYS